MKVNTRWLKIFAGRRAVWFRVCGYGVSVYKKLPAGFLFSERLHWYRRIPVGFGHYMKGLRP